MASSPKNDEARRGFIKLVKIGCTCRLLPYKWNPENKLLQPASQWNLYAFNLQSYFTILYTGFMWFRLVHAYIGGEFSLLAALWGLANTTCSAGFVTLLVYQNDVMHYANRLLDNTLLEKEKSKMGERNNEGMNQVESQSLKSLSHHMSFNMFLLYSNPTLHFHLMYTNPCAPNFISSLFFECKTSLDDVDFYSKSGFILFEYYNVFKWQYIVSFSWCCIYFGMSFIGIELKKLAGPRLFKLSTISGAHGFHRNIKKCELMIKIINEIFWYYMSVFPLVGCAVVALLLYGTIRLWRLGPQAVIMFPLCAIRCGFEALTPLSIAGSMSQDSNMVLEKWAKNLKMEGNKFVRMMRRDCRRLKCRCGSLFSFGKVILLVTVDVCVNQTVNLLVSF